MARLLADLAAQWMKWYKENKGGKFSFCWKQIKEKTQ